MQSDRQVQIADRHHVNNSLIRVFPPVSESLRDGWVILVDLDHYQGKLEASVRTKTKAGGHVDFLKYSSGKRQQK